MGDRLAARCIALCLKGGKKVQQNVRFMEQTVPQIGVRWASGGATNPAREAKEASPLKVVKKGSAVVKYEGLEKRDKFAGLFLACLDVPSPVRHSKEKDRL